MELILINENKLKIILSDCDMKQYSLCCGSKDCDSEKIKSIFKEILNEAKKKVGFDADETRVFIQLYPSKTGGGEMYVSKLNYDYKENEFESNLEISPAEKTSRHKNAYSFENLQNLISVCKILYEYDEFSDSELWFEGNKYFLIISENEENIYIVPNENTFICEYGKRENLKNTLLFISEHAKCICENNAVQTLSKL